MLRLHALLRPASLFIACVSIAACGDHGTSTTASAPSVNAAATPSAAPTPDSAGRSLQAFCTIAETVKADSTINIAERAPQILQRLMASNPDPALMSFLQGLSGTSAEQRAGRLSAFGAEHGVANFSCPALTDF